MKDLIEAIRAAEAAIPTNLVADILKAQRAADAAMTPDVIKAITEGSHAAARAEAAYKSIQQVPQPFFDAVHSAFHSTYGSFAVPPVMEPAKSITERPVEEAPEVVALKNQLRDVLECHDNLADHVAELRKEKAADAAKIRQLELEIEHLRGQLYPEA